MNNPVNASVAYDVDGTPVQSREVLNATNGGVSCPPNATTTIAAFSAGKFTYLQRIEIVATVAAVAAGNVSVQVGGVTVYVFSIPAILAIGSKLVAEFPSPPSFFLGNVDVVVPANGGTWLATANGFYSRK